MVVYEPSPICKSNVAECCYCFQFCNKFCPVIEYLKFLAWIQLIYFT